MENSCMSCGQHREILLRVAECMDHNGVYDHKKDVYTRAAHETSQGNVICIACALKRVGDSD